MVFLLHMHDSKPENTKLAYDRKTREFIEFCEAIFPVNNDDNRGGMGINPALVTEEKLFGFLHYQS